MELTINDLGVYERCEIFSYISDLGDFSAMRCVCRAWRQDISAPICNYKPYYESNEEPIAIACALNSKRLILRAIARGFTDYQLGLENAFANNSILAAQMMMDRGANYYRGAMEKACEHDKLEIIQFIMGRVELEADDFIKYAYLYGRKRIADYFIERGATDFTSALVGACSGGHLDLVKDALERDVYPDFYHPIYCACQYDHFDVIEYLINRYPNYNSHAINAAYTYGRKNIAEFLLLRIQDVNGKKKAIQDGIKSFIHNNYVLKPIDKLPFISYLISQGADINDLFLAECKYGGSYATLLAPLAPTLWKRSIAIARENGYYDVAQFIESLASAPQ